MRFAAESYIDHSISCDIMKNLSALEQVRRSGGNEMLGIANLLQIRYIRYDTWSGSSSYAGHKDFAEIENTVKEWTDFEEDIGSGKLWLVVK